MNKIVVGISDQKLCKSPDVLVTYALGSCVGICMIDKVLGIAGLAHIMLPDSSAIPNDKNKFKFADTGIQLLYESMIKKRCGGIENNRKNSRRSEYVCYHNTCYVYRRP